MASERRQEKWPEVLQALKPVRLPDAAPDFPVQAEYRVASDLGKLVGPLIECDAALPRYLAEKMQALTLRPDALLLPPEVPPAGVWPAIWHALSLDEASVTHALGLTINESIASLGLCEAAFPDAGNVTAKAKALVLSLAMQEDWVLMGAQGQFEAGSVCFPSGWVPAEKFGQSLAHIHGPVADGEALRKASGALVRAMSFKGPFQRYVWTLTHSASLARHPDWPDPDQDSTAPSAGFATRVEGALSAAHGVPQRSRPIYFRTERQTTLPLPQYGRALFLIRVKVWPLDLALGTSTRAARLALLKSALGSMSERVLAYKNLGAIREAVMAMR